MENNIKKMQNKLLEKFIFLKDILDKGQIEFSLEAGTIIGAIREKGFLPWDDDIDIMIPEDEEARFCKLIKDTEGVSLKNYKNKSMNSFYKVYFDEFVKNGRQKSSLKIDVFTIYKEREFSFFQNLKRVVYVGLLDFKSFAPTRYFANIIIPVTKKHLRDKARKAIKSGKIIESKNGYLYDDINYWNANKSNMYRYRKYEKGSFEGLSINIPFEARETMMPVYGDILVPPEKNNKKNHGTKLL